ncbi:LacI family DNA-binding transcriptional regulator [Streptomyces antibioticus]|uniref:Substrate-binding domain-containing protein n=1 Tax=Streptomyces antibioticus TaxID=1890 RepID=A0AAE6YCR1_STRAT|nr:substrate-binding domain-containing protein [Streptomyces antibioticus]OOQ46976.1 hypothetical protein AFM16_29725 [Streptomyces antibioticus]QIT47276.1 substrate-binding domain-containing protein [Streptomyces antibioticus]
MTTGPTLAVVAREAGVSVPTASKVVNGREDVAPETRRRVTEALNRLGYARRPRFDQTKPPRLVDLVVPFDESTAHRRTRELLDLPDPPTAVFVCSDRMALGVYRAVLERGLRIPYDISVVGFDDLPESRWAAPALTTVRQPLAEMAATALRLLVRMMDGECPEGTRTELSTRLVERASTAPPPARAR